MKSLFLAAIALAALSGCHSAANGATANSDPGQSGSANSAKANWSCSINGTPVSGGDIDDMQLANTAFYYPDKDHKENILIEFSSKSATDPKPAYFIKMKFPAKTGTYTYDGKNEYDIHTNPLFVLDFQSGDMARYWIGRQLTAGKSDHVTVTITSITATTVSGTFSAEMSPSNDTPNAKTKAVSVTDGKFDVPFSTGNLRPE